jgi:hypothetical protein
MPETIYWCLIYSFLSLTVKVIREAGMKLKTIAKIKAAPIPLSTLLREPN